MKRAFKVLAVVMTLGFTSLLANDGALLYKSCVGCHGLNGEKKALGKSAVITGWKVEKTIEALKGYKDGSYGGAMKGVMKGQVARLNDESIKAIAAHIAALK